MLDWEAAEISISAQAELLGLNRSGLYYQAVGPSNQEVIIKHRIDEIYTQYPFYGSRRIRVVLVGEEYSISRPTVQRYMREMCIAGITPGPNLSKRNQQNKIYPYLLRGMVIQRPNQVWGIDITYIRLRRGWMYLVAIIDWYSRFVLAWELDQTLQMPFVLHAVETALQIATPDIWNSDQGSHFTSPQYIERLLAASVRISMDGKGRALDNVLTERLWRTIKYEEVYLKSYDSPRDARINLGQYLNFYNTQRPHQSLHYLTPAHVFCHPEALSGASG